MSKAFKCDRCGKCFAPSKEEHFVRIKEIVNGDSEYFTERFESADLCFECSNEFRRWFNIFRKSIDGDELS